MIAVQLYRPEAILHGDLKICAHDDDGKPELPEWLSANINLRLIDFDPEDHKHVLLTRLGFWLSEFGRPN